MYIIGIDPGKNGGIVALNNGKVVSISTMPSSIEGIWDHFIYLGFPKLIKQEETYVFIERVHSMPKDGAKAAFTFGRHNGILDTILAILCSKVKVSRVVSREWMGYFKLRREDNEAKYAYKKRICDYARRKASQSRGASQKSSITLKTADAYLIALYGYNQMKGKK